MVEDNDSGSYEHDEWPNLANVDHHHSIKMPLMTLMTIIRSKNLNFF